MSTSPNAPAYHASASSFGVDMTGHAIKLFDRLKESGINYSDAARLLGVTPRCVRMYRSGTIRVPYTMIFALQMLCDEHASA